MPEAKNMGREGEKAEAWNEDDGGRRVKRPKPGTKMMGEGG